jgi:hypothetical protein
LQISQDLITNYLERKEASEEVDRLSFNENNVVMICVASSSTELTRDIYIEGDLILQEDGQEFQVSRSDTFILGGDNFVGVIHDFAVWNDYFDADKIHEIFESRCNSGAIMGAFPELEPVLIGHVNYLEGWSKWSEWTPCSASCGENGKQLRERKCFSLDEETGGCSGSTQENKTCGPLICANWAEWSDWSACSKSCGDGFIHRNRPCLFGKPGETGCEGESDTMNTCNLDICPDPYDFPWECGTVTANTGIHTMRIVNGKTESYGAIPYLCQLTSYGDHNCGTSIISPAWNIGAAHCVADFDMPEQFRLICGSHHRVEIDTYEQQRSVKQYIKHPGYDTMADNVDYDMMLFQGRDRPLLNYYNYIGRRPMFSFRQIRLLKMYSRISGFYFL